MPELKFKAVDTSLAMEEVQRKLGPDALILSTERRDGMIEIVATNDPDQVEAANLKAREKLKVRRENGMIEKSKSDNSFHKFPEIIEAEKAKYDDNLDIEHTDFSEGQDQDRLALASKAFGKSDLIPAISRITNELQLLIDGAMSLAAVEDHSPSVNLRMKMLGFSNKTVNNLLKSTEANADLEDAIKQFTRNIVRGKSKDFDTSQIVLVCGDERSGKTVLSKKLSKFLPTNVDGQINRVISDSLSGNLSSLFQADADANITSLFRKRQDTNLNDGRLIVDYEGPMDVLNSVLMKLNNIEQKPTVSVIYALEVGKSYNAIQKLLEISQIPNLSIALTKMDLLEVSVAELSAIFDLGIKIQFFSGLKVLEDGLDFAKISVVQDFLLNVAKQEGL